MKTFPKKNISGFALVEILVATSIITVTLLSVATIAQSSIKMSRRSLNASEASYLVEEGAEAVKIIRDNAWSNISGLTNGTTYYLSYSGGTWSLSTTVSTIGIFTRTIVFSAVNRDSNDDITSSGGTADTGTRLVTETVSWPDGSTTATKTLSLYIADIFS